MSKKLEKPEKFYLLKKVADFLSVSKRQVYRLVDAGDLIMVKVGNRSMVPESSLVAYQERLMKRGWR